MALRRADFGMLRGMWGWLKRWVGKGTKGGLEQGFELSASRPELAEQSPVWLEAADSPLGVRVLDVRPVTLGMLSATDDPKKAENAGSYNLELGDSFAGQEPELATPVSGELRFRAPEALVNGSWFIPEVMEDKWALFLHDGSLLLVRGWLRAVFLRAQVEQVGEELRIHQIRGSFTGSEEDPAFTRRALEFLLRTQALDEVWPAPLPSDAGDPMALARFCMSVFGRAAHYALDYRAELPALPAGKPLRTRTRLHLAVMQGDEAEVKRRSTRASLSICLAAPASRRCSARWRSARPSVLPSLASWRSC